MARARILVNVFYNKDIKERFIETQKDTLKPTYITIFRNSESYERRKGKDLYDFSITEIKEYYKYLYKPTVKALLVVHGAIRRYVEWAGVNGYTDKSFAELGQLTASNLDEFINHKMADSYVTDRETILEWIRSLKEDFDYYNPRDAFMILAPFEGISGCKMHEITDITQKDIFKKNKQYYAKVGNRTIPISEELYEIAQESIKESTYCSGTNRHGTLSIYALETNDKIVRLIQGKNSKEFGYNNLVKQVRRALTRIGVNNITVKHIILSGKMHMIREKAEEHELSIKDYLCSEFFKTEVCYQFDMSTENVYNHINNFRLLMGVNTKA